MTDVHDRPIPAPEERHNTLVAVVPPFMLRTPDNPAGVPIEVFDGLRAASPVDRWQLYRDLAGHRNALECIAAFSGHRLP